MSCLSEAQDLTPKRHCCDYVDPSLVASGCIRLEVVQDRRSSKFQYDCASSLQSSGAADCASPCQLAGLRNEDSIHDVRNMTSVDEFELPLPSLAPALAAPDIKPSVEGTSS